jgi:hypothetical protein
MFSCDCSRESGGARATARQGRCLPTVVASWGTPGAQAGRPCILSSNSAVPPASRWASRRYSSYNEAGAGLRRLKRIRSPNCRLRRSVSSLSLAPASPDSFSVSSTISPPATYASTRQMFPFAYDPSPMAAPRLLLLLHYSYQPPPLPTLDGAAGGLELPCVRRSHPLLMATVSGGGWSEVKKTISSIHRAARRTSWTRRPSLGRFAAAAVVLLVWFSSATDKEREAISVAKKTRS